MDSEEEKISIIVDSWGFCIVCGNYDDLRLGHCFGCADVAKGEEDVCRFGGLGNHDQLNEFCSIRCKYSISCRRQQIKGENTNESTKKIERA